MSVLVIVSILLVVVVAIVAAWITSEYTDNKVWVRICLGSLAILCCWSIGVIAAQIVRLNYNIWYSDATKKLLAATLDRLENGEQKVAIEKLKDLHSQLQATYERKGNYDELVRETVKEMNKARIIGVILPAKADRNIHLDAGKPEGFWQPSENIIKKAEPEILEFIKNDSPGIFKNIIQYRCQYIGIMIKGKKRIYCNFFRSEHKAGWKENMVSVDDGGDDFFHLEYDVETGKCLNLEVNGNA
ncbi:MAG: hypothetical protein WCS27_09855 [Victivallaceae bacterium]